MLEDATQELLTIKDQLVKYFEDFLDPSSKEFINVLLLHIVKILNKLYIKGETTIVYKHHVKNVIFNRIIKDKKIVEAWNHRPILWLRDELFDFLILHQFIIETVPDNAEQIRTSYNLGPKSVDLFMNLFI